MQHRLNELRRRRAAGESGFTLLELLVVVVIIGILIAIAIPVYLNYEKGAKDKSAASDVRNAVTTLEQCLADNSVYPKAVPSTGGDLTETGCSGQQINLSPGTSIGYRLRPGPPESYILVGRNSGGSGKLYCYNSARGGSVKAITGRKNVHRTAP